MIDAPRITCDSCWFQIPDSCVRLFGSVRGVGGRGSRDGTVVWGGRAAPLQRVPPQHDTVHAPVQPPGQTQASEMVRCLSSESKSQTSAPVRNLQYGSLAIYVMVEIVKTTVRHTGRRSTP